MALPALFIVSKQKGPYIEVWLGSTPHPVTVAKKGLSKEVWHKIQSYEVLKQKTNATTRPQTKRDKGETRTQNTGRQRRDERNNDQHGHQRDRKKRTKRREQQHEKTPRAKDEHDNKTTKATTRHKTKRDKGGQGHRTQDDMGETNGTTTNTGTNETERKKHPQRSSQGASTSVEQPAHPRQFGSRRAAGTHLWWKQYPRTTAQTHTAQQYRKSEQRPTTNANPGERQRKTKDNKGENTSRVCWNSHKVTRKATGVEVCCRCAEVFVTLGASLLHLCCFACKTDLHTAAFFARPFPRLRSHGEERRWATSVGQTARHYSGGVGRARGCASSRCPEESPASGRAWPAASPPCEGRRGGHSRGRVAAGVFSGVSGWTKHRVCETAWVLWRGAEQNTTCCAPNKGWPGPSTGPTLRPNKPQLLLSNNSCRRRRPKLSARPKVGMERSPEEHRLLARQMGLTPAQYQAWQVQQAANAVPLQQQLPPPPRPRSRSRSGRRGRGGGWGGRPGGVTGKTTPPA